MCRKNAALLLLLTLTSVLLAPNCTTLTQKWTQSIPVTSSPTRATVSVNGVRQGVTPLGIRLVRKQKVQVVRIESPGYNPIEIRPQKRRSGKNILGNAFLGAIVGYGAAFGYSWATEGLKMENALDISYPVWLVGTLAFGGLFTLIDSERYSFTPTEFTVTLTRAEGPPRVDTMLVDADDFANIKWIRVRKD
jgi:hypothetical protein